MSTLAHGVTLVHCTKAAARDIGEAASHQVALHCITLYKTASDQVAAVDNSISSLSAAATAEILSQTMGNTISNVSVSISSSCCCYTYYIIEISPKQYSGATFSYLKSNVI